MAAILGLQLLKLTPLLTSTINLQFANDEWQFLTPWVETFAKDTSLARQVLPGWANRWQSRALWQALICLPLPIISGIAMHFALRPGTALSILIDPFLSKWTGPAVDAARWYLVGSGFALAHFAFGTTAMRLLGQMKGESKKEKERNVESVAEWLDLHRLRTLVSDVPAFACFLMATVRLGYIIDAPIV
ncbi:hypothetical protein DOTSEDRAFT_72736 [Dothistroma septosporum NZE10]|uniref:Uncharacterized protein n=1 Tax=Dothistroma septosporum (strain NZE10 / CBS 128990) TaxID=675120 RepID=M2YNA3_DOTSN|nr:hypothetical protein DOTSEDRAFT_72736 [Dothistroma septosporum NZE10]